jgi:hypothetical protein
VAGYRRARVIELKFHGADVGEMDGFEITLRRLSVNEMLDVAALADIPDGASADDTNKLIFELTETIADKIVTWNLEAEDGSPIAPSGDALRGEDLGFTHSILDAWIDATTGVPAPLARNSSAGEPSPALSLPMEPLSASPGSFSGPS